MFLQQTMNSDKYVGEILNYLINQLTAEENQYTYFHQNNIHILPKSHWLLYIRC
jgi:hypothetical protein